MRTPCTAATRAIRRTGTQKGLHMLVQQGFSFFRLQACTLPQLQVQLLVVACQRRAFAGQIEQ